MSDTPYRAKGYTYDDERPKYKGGPRFPPTIEGRYAYLLYLLRMRRDVCDYIRGRYNYA